MKKAFPILIGLGVLAILWRTFAARPRATGSAPDLASRSGLETDPNPATAAVFDPNLRDDAITFLPAPRDPNYRGYDGSGINWQLGQRHY